MFGGRRVAAHATGVGVDARILPRSRGSCLRPDFGGDRRPAPQAAPPNGPSWSP